MGSFKYDLMQNTLSILYTGFRHIQGVARPGKILYTSIFKRHFNVGHYPEGKTMFSTKLLRCSFHPGIALAFCGQKGAMIAIELDSGLPHYHLRVKTVLSNKTAHPSGVYIFPWLCFKVQKVIETEDVFLIKVVQVPWTKEQEEGLTMNEYYEQGNFNSSTTKLYHKSNTDVKGVYSVELVRS
mmetsp:Transcript_21961/g.19515  ORF Transcript_21961/g.19515 Transcript_21961/m.19515 type:complete len:183 (+) Transcript_21961:280-828(+)